MHFMQMFATAVCVLSLVVFIITDGFGFTLHFDTQSHSLHLTLIASSLVVLNALVQNDPISRHKNQSYIAIGAVIAENHMIAHVRKSEHILI